MFVANFFKNWSLQYFQKYLSVYRLNANQITNVCAIDKKNSSNISLAEYGKKRVKSPSTWHGGWQWDNVGDNETTWVRMGQGGWEWDSVGDNETTWVRMRQHGWEWDNAGENETKRVTVIQSASRQTMKTYLYIFADLHVRLCYATTEKVSERDGKCEFIRVIETC